MTSQPYSRAEALFLAASELAANKREAYLRAECGNDTELYAEVIALLAASEESENYFRQLPGRLGIGWLREGNDSEQLFKAKTGQLVGRYRLTTRLASGGTGEVWRAERSDGRFEGEVAIKLLTRIGSRSTARQFEGEANYLARLNNGNIARLFDAGIGPDETPYLVLEYVDGQPIDRHCDDEQLDIAERLHLFVQVLDAVSHAHSRLIVHSDIKPTNVLVTKDGIVKLLDFGIATFLSATSASGTGAGLTPEYAAPEQLAGSSITTATDIYSLGLLLYVLLAGCNPRETSKARNLEEIRREALQCPPSLSTTVSDLADSDSAALKRLASARQVTCDRYIHLLRGELDHIVAKALAVDAHDRYETAAAFAADLRRFLRREPVTAYPDSIRYRAGKFLQRHLGVVLIGCLALVAVIASAVIATWQGIEAQRQREIAVRGEERALATNMLLNKILGELGPNGDRVSMQELLDRGVSIVDQEYGTSELATAAVLYDLSILYGRLGQIEKQIALLDRAESIGESLGDRVIVARMLCAKARLKRESDAAASSHDLAAGLAAFDSVARRERVLLVECYRAKALSQSAEGDHDAAIATYRAAVDILDSTTVSSAGWRLTLLNDIAEQYFLTNRFSHALNILDEIIRENERLGRDRSVNHIIMLANRGAVLQRFGEVRLASVSQGEAWRLVQGMENAPVGIGMHYARSLLQMAEYEHAYEILNDDFERASESGNDRFRAQIALLMAIALLELGQPVKAAEYADITARIFTDSPAFSTGLRVTLDEVRARLLLAKGNASAARRAIKDVLDRLSYPAAKDGSGLSGALWTATEIELAAGDAATALAYATDELALTIKTARDPDYSAYVGRALHQRAQAYMELGEQTAAVVELERAIVSLTGGFGEDHVETTAAKNLLIRLKR